MKYKNKYLQINTQYAGSKKLTGYIYVPKESLQLIKKHGYLSIRKQVELMPELKKTIIRKYKDQMKNAIKSFSELKQLIPQNATQMEKILLYLDWRDAETLQGSKAIYFLFSPVPNDEKIIDFIKKYRGDFLRNRILLEIEIPDNYIVVNGRQKTDYFRKSIDWWKQHWYSVMKTKKNQLWFEDIPHAYIVPKSGKIDPKKIRMPPILEEYNKSHAKKVFELHKKVFKYTACPIKMEELENLKGWVIFYDQHIIAYLLYSKFISPSNKKEWYCLEYIGTDPEHQRKRLGQQLIDEFHKKAENDGVPMFLRVEMNSPYTKILLKWYSKNGYIEKRKEESEKCPGVFFITMIRELV